MLFPPVYEPRDKKIKKIVGLIISMSGVILYTVFEIKNKKELHPIVNEEKMALKSSENLLAKETFAQISDDDQK